MSVAQPLSNPAPGIHQLDPTRMAPSAQSASSSLAQRKSLDLKTFDSHHYIMKRILSELTFAPDPPKDATDFKALDVGTGMGNWAIDMAETHPNISVTGFDHRLVVPPSRELPKNCTLELEDINRPGGMKYASNSYDRIFVRRLGLEVKDWNHALKELVRITKPGGYIELHELNPKPFYNKEMTSEEVEADLWNNLINSVAGTMNCEGSDIFAAEKLVGILKELGMEVELDKVEDLPMGGEWTQDPLMKEIGEMQLAALSKTVDEFSLGFYTRMMGQPYDQAMAISEIHKDSVAKQSANFHGYNHLHIIVARKPIA